VGAAVQTLVGQSLGRDDVPGARRAAWGGVGLAVMAIMIKAMKGRITRFDWVSCSI